MRNAVLRAALSAPALLLFLVAVPPAGAQQFVRDYEVGIDAVARELAEGLSLQARGSDGPLKTSIIRQAREAAGLVCEPFSSKLAGRVNDGLTDFLAGFRLDRIDSQRLESGEDSVAVAVRWSVEDSRTVMITAEATRFPDLKILTSASAFVSMETIPESDRVCLLSESLFAQCSAEGPVAVFDSPVPERANLVGQIPAGTPFFVRGAYNLGERDALALLVSWSAGTATGNATEELRAFALGGSRQLQDWSRGERPVCSVTNWGPYRPEGPRTPWRANYPMPDRCDDCPPMMVLPEITVSTAALAGSPTGPETLVGAGVDVAVAGLIAMSETEITVEQWQACARAGGCPDLRETATGNRPYNAPVSVSYAQAQRYVDWLNTRAGGIAFRLPTEAEWEFAARGEAGYRAGQGQELRYWWGDVMLEGHAVCRGCAPGAVPDGPAPAGLDRDRISRWGLADMAGNLWEWVDACVEPGAEPRPARVCASGRRVVKGGSYMDPPLALAVSHRAEAPETLAHPAIGFRVVASDPAPR